MEVLERYLSEIDVALCMTVHPGFSGQAFLSESPERIQQLRQLIDRVHPGCELEVDGGIDRRVAATVVQAGATVLVSATGIFGQPEPPGEAVRLLRAAVTVE